MKIAVLFLMLVIISGMSLIGINQAFADACLSNVAGTWNDPNTWTNCGVGGVPDNLGDSANIQINGDVQLNNDFTVNSVSVIEGGSLSVNAKLTAQDLEVGANSDLFINCNGEFVLTEGGSNNGLLTNHGIFRTLQFVSFENSGTYQSSGTDIFGGAFNANPNPIVQIPSICVVGGTVIPIDSTALLLAGAQSTSWMIPVILSGIGIGLFAVSRKSENS